MNQPQTSSWDDRVGLSRAGWRKVMMWLFIVTDGLLFAGFLASYGVTRLASPEWPPIGDIFSLGFLTTMTFVLISSSATMAAAVAASAAGDRTRAARFIWLTVLGGTIFLGMQAIEWTQLIGEHVTLSANPWNVPTFGAYFFLITGFHGTHVLSGILILAATALRVGKGVTPPVGVEMAGLYWHFIDLIWVFIFTLFYLL